MLFYDDNIISLSSLLRFISRSNEILIVDDTKGEILTLGGTFSPLLYGSFTLSLFFPVFVSARLSMFGSERPSSVTHLEGGLMPNHQLTSVFVVIPNLNGAEQLPASLDSVLAQSYQDLRLVIVDNGSTDNSREIIETYKQRDPRITAIFRDKNYGYTGGVNPGMELAIKAGAQFVATFNNDAIADIDWLKELVHFLREHPDFGIAACKLLHADGKTFDSTGDQYSVWGIPHPRGRDEEVSDRYDTQTLVFGASGGASLYRTRMLADIGLLDEDFFAYYEDVDLSFRAQLAGWKVAYVPKAIVYHEQGKTSSRMKSGFVNYQCVKNLPYILIKDVPARLLFHIVPRFALIYLMTLVYLILYRRQGGPVIKGLLEFLMHLPKKLVERRRIQKHRKVSPAYIWSVLLHSLPPPLAPKNPDNFKGLRAIWWRLRTGQGIKPSKREAVWETVGHGGTQNHQTKIPTTGRATQ
jgi:GT2 family glycosyltransferase